MSPEFWLTTLVVVAVPGTAVLHTLLLSALFMAATFAVFALYGLLAGAVREHVVTRPRVVLRVRRSVAIGFAALAGRLALAER